MTRYMLALVLGIALLLNVSHAAFARARGVAVFPLRAASQIANQATQATKAIAQRLASVDGYDAKVLPTPAQGTLGSAAASSGAEIYVVGQLLSSDNGFQLIVGSFEAATDKSLGEYRATLQAPSQLPDQPDIKLLLQGVGATANSQTAALSSSGNVLVPVGLAVAITLDSPISSDTAKAGDKFAFKAAEDVASEGRIVIQKGAGGEGEVALAEASGGNGHPGKLGLQFDWIASVDGSKIQLSSTQKASDGEGSKGAASTATIASYVLLGPLGLFAHNFVHGKNSTLDEHSKLKAYVAHTVHVASQLDAHSAGYAK